MQQQQPLILEPQRHTFTAQSANRASSQLVGPIQQRNLSLQHVMDEDGSSRVILMNRGQSINLQDSSIDSKTLQPVQ